MEDRAEDIVDEILWSLSWNAALTPELPMIPDRRVFLCTPQGRSLTATVEGISGLLLSDTDPVFVSLLKDDSGTLGGGDEDVLTTLTSELATT